MTRRTRREFIGTGALAACGRAADERPNIVIYYVDELRATALRMHNPDGLATPNLERLAQRGVTFDNAFTPHPLCMPARSSLWTGQYTHTTGSRDNQHPLRDDRVTMSDILHKAGYALGIFGKNHCFTAPQLKRWFAANYSSGSRQWNEALTPQVAGQVKALRKWIADRGGGTMPPEAHPFPAEVCDTHLCTQRAIEFIEKKRQGPFAAWISITDPHHPMQAPESFARGVPSPGQVKLPPYRKGEIRGKNTRMQIYEYLVRGEEIPEDFLRRYLSIYYAMVAQIDHEVGRLMTTLERTGLDRNTIVLFTSDHGDFAGEHHLILKTGSMLDSMVRIPLILSWPGRVARGLREKALVSHVDLMPTLLQFCGLSVPQSVEGIALPLQSSARRRDWIYSEYGAGEAEFTWEDARKLGPAKRLGDYSLKSQAESQGLEKREHGGHLRMARTHTHKLSVDSNDEVEFYDLVKDPHETENVHGRPEYRAAEEDLRRKLETMK